MTREDVWQWVVLALLFIGQVMLGRRLNFHLEIFKAFDARLNLIKQDVRSLMGDGR